PPAPGGPPGGPPTPIGPIGPPTPGGPNGPGNGLFRDREAMLIGPARSSRPANFSRSTAFLTSAACLSQAATADLKSAPVSFTANETRTVSAGTFTVAVPVTVIRRSASFPPPAGWP